MSDEIGERWSELLARVTEALDFEPVLTDRERDFAEGLRSRLETYKDRTYVSAKQLNWLTVIEAKIDKERDLA